MNKKIIIGVIGEMGSGKSTVARYLTEKYAASHYRFSDFLRKILEQLYIPATRTHLIDLFLVLAERFGEEVLARPMKELVEADNHTYIVVEGIRRPADIVELRKLPHFYLLGIKTEETERYSRISRRHENTDDSTKTFAVFKADEQRPTEILIKTMIEQADYQIINNGSLEDLYKKIDDLILKLK